MRSKRECVIVRAIWGDAGVGTRPKVVDDVGALIRRGGVSEYGVCFAFGEQNAAVWRAAGLSPILLSDEPLVDFLRAGERTLAADRDQLGLGRITFGLSMWRHKLEAIRAAFVRLGAQAVVWLDVDTVTVRRPDDRMWERLADGPPFQGRLRRYTHPQCPWRRRRLERRHVYHGGCYYFRSLSLIERVIEVQESRRWRLWTDETCVTKVVEDVLVEGGTEDVRAHRAAGTDSPWFYDVLKGRATIPAPRRRVLRAERLLKGKGERAACAEYPDPYFREGIGVRPRRWYLREWRAGQADQRSPARAEEISENAD